MPHENPQALHIHEEAKAAFTKAETVWRKTSKALNRLRRERYDTKEEVTEAERQAECAYQLALAVLSGAREHWRLIQCTVPKHKYHYRHQEKEIEEGGVE